MRVLPFQVEAQSAASRPQRGDGPQTRPEAPFADVFAKVRGPRRSSPDAKPNAEAPKASDAAHAANKPRREAVRPADEAQADTQDAGGLVDAASEQLDSGASGAVAVQAGIDGASSMSEGTSAAATVPLMDSEHAGGVVKPAGVGPATASVGAGLAAEAGQSPPTEGIEQAQQQGKQIERSAQAAGQTPTATPLVEAPVREASPEVSSLVAAQSPSKPILTKQETIGLEPGGQHADVAPVAGGVAADSSTTHDDAAGQGEQQHAPPHLAKSAPQPSGAATIYEAPAPQPMAAPVSPSGGPAPTPLLMGDGAGGTASGGDASAAADAPDDAGVARLNAARVARGLQNAVQQGGGAVTLRLTPVELGTVRVQMQLHGTTVAAQLQTETESARSVLSQQLSQLRSALEGQGLQVERLQVQVMQPGGQSSTSQQQQDFAGQDGRSRGFAGHEGGGGSSPRRDSDQRRRDTFERMLGSQVA